jgi:hypothetical protein
LNAPQKFPFARTSAGPAPLRRPGSIRRTSSIDSRWPEGVGQPWCLEGRAQDLLTPADGSAPSVVAHGSFSITASPMREILKVEVSPPHPRSHELVGVRAGGQSRVALVGIMGDVRGTPLYQLLDDFAGASLVAGWIWSQWNPDWRKDRAIPEGAKGPREGVCTGFAPGASALASDGSVEVNHSSTVVGPFNNPDDPAGWHVLGEQQGSPQSRRARRIDLWREDGLIKVDAAFQDSGPGPTGARIAIHEYRVHAEVDPASGVLVTMQVLPLILPFQECPGASIKATRMIGQKVGDFRNAVIDTLPTTMGCTHLNDVLRGLSDIPVLANRLS